MTCSCVPPNSTPQFVQYSKYFQAPYSATPFPCSVFYAFTFSELRKKAAPRPRLNSPVPECVPRSGSRPPPSPRSGFLDIGLIAKKVAEGHLAIKPRKSSMTVSVPKSRENPTLFFAAGLSVVQLATLGQREKALCVCTLFERCTCFCVCLFVLARVCVCV